MKQEDTIEVVGAGLRTPAGNSLASFLAGLCSVPDTQTVDVAGTPLLSRSVRANMTEYFKPSVLRRLDRTHQLAMMSADDALKSVDFALPAAGRCAVSVGIGYGPSHYSEQQFRSFLEGGVRAVNPLTIPIVMPNSIAAHLSLRFGFTGPAMTYATACAAGANAIGEALWMLRTRRADLVLAGGVDALLVPGPASFFLRTEAMSQNFEAPNYSSRPFDRDRDGFVLSEGSGFVVLVRSSDYERSIGPSIGKILGYGATSDAHHLVAPAPGGRGAAACMQLAMRDAGVAPSEIGHINAHGTSTVRNDIAESDAIRTAFGSAGPAVTAPKGTLGHMIGGAGAVECIASLLSAGAGWVAPVQGLEHLDPEVDIDLVVGEPRRLDNTIALTNSFGFGGHNASLVVEGHVNAMTTSPLEEVACE